MNLRLLVQKYMPENLKILLDIDNFTLTEDEDKIQEFFKIVRIFCNL